MRLPGASVPPVLSAMDSSSDVTLLEAWSKGHQEAFEILVGRYQRALLAHSRALLGSTGAVEDAVQEAFLRLATKPPRVAELEPELRVGAARSSRLGSWLHKVTRNACMDQLRTEGRRREREARVASAESDAGGLDRVEAADTRAAVEAGLGRLKAEEREVVALRLIAERSYAEIAEITGRKLGTVSWLLSRGLKALARELEPLFGEPAPAPERSHLPHNGTSVLAPEPAPRSFPARPAHGGELP